MTDGGSALMKTRPHPPPGFFAAEAHGLAWLAEAGGAPVPEVLAVDDDCLLVAWIETAPATAETAEGFGRSLAITHRAGASGFGAARDGYIGAIPLPNRSAATWPEFYATRRVEPYLRAAKDRGATAPASTGTMAPRSLAGPQVRFDPPGGVELRPRRGGPVRQRDGPDVAIARGAEAAGTGPVGDRQRSAEALGRLGGGRRSLDPGHEQAVVVDGEHLGHRRPARLGQPRQPVSLSSEEAGRRVRPGLHQRAAAVGHAYPGGSADGAPRHRSGRRNRPTQQLLGAGCDRGHPRHGDHRTAPGPTGGPVP
jgi:hypothetical protein